MHNTICQFAKIPTQINLHVLHIGPAHPSLHMQVNLLIPSTQEPPFIHGEDRHSSKSKHKIKC